MTKFKALIAMICGVSVLCAVALMAQDPAPAAPDQPPPAVALTPDQLDNLVAPVALYPDPLLSQVLVASTYPLEIVEANQWLQQNKNLSGQALLDAARQQNWDPSVQALVALPDVMTRLTQDVRWTTDLGNAFLAQQADVMSAVQRMRGKAQTNGKLQSTQQQTVSTENENGQSAITILPANPQVIYVPTYNPEWVWGPPVFGYYPPLFYPGIGIGFGFGPGIYIGGFFGGCCGWGSFGWGWGPNWFGHTILVNNYFLHRYGFNDFHGGAFRGTGVWAHDAAHRQGVPYANRALSEAIPRRRSRSRSQPGSGSSRPICRPNRRIRIAGIRTPESRRESQRIWRNSRWRANPHPERSRILQHAARRWWRRWRRRRWRIPRRRRWWWRRSQGAMMKALILISAGALMFAQAQKTFDSPEAAASALIDAAAADNVADLNAIFGTQGKTILTSGDPARDKAEREEFVSIAKSKHELQKDSMDRNRMILSIGQDDWPFPVPIVKKDGVWKFDTSMGAQAMRARRVGANEMDAIEICAGFAGAEHAYAERSPMHEYAATLAALEPQVLKDFAAATGATAKPYHGYVFAVLKSQGPSSPGGRHDYVVSSQKKSSMMGGFALVAWPAVYGVTGVHTFIVNQDGLVYEKDLGAHAGAPVATYNPDASWRTVN